MSHLHDSQVIRSVRRYVRQHLSPRLTVHVLPESMDRTKNRETTSMPVPEHVRRLGGAPLAICPPPSPPISMLSRHETHCLRASPLRCWAHISPTLRWGGGGGALALPLLSPAIPNINSMPITLQRDQRGVTDEKMATFMFPYRQHWRSINASRQRKLCARAHTHTRTHARRHAHTHTHTQTKKHTHTHRQMHVHRDIWMERQRDIHLNMYIHVLRSHAHTQTRTHARVCVWV